MSTKPWGRKKLRQERRDTVADPVAGGRRDDDPVKLDEDEHAWWAAREDLEEVYVPKAKVADEPRRSVFFEYYSTESLFAWGDGSAQNFDDDPDAVYHGDPYALLGLTPDATWREVSVTHRRLAKKHHPDRFVGANPLERRRNEKQMQEINIAYAELRRRRGK